MYYVLGIMYCILYIIYCILYFVCCILYIIYYRLCIRYYISYIDYLLTECEVCTGKYLPEVFVQTERRRSEVCAEKAEGKYFPVQTEQTRLIRNLLYGF